MSTAKKQAYETTLGAGSPFRTEGDLVVNRELSEFYDNCGLSTIDKLQSFPAFVRRQDLTKMLSRYELFKHSLDVHGSVVELGVCLGNGIFSFAKFSSILEPTNNSRRFFGFDTFSGFPSIAKEDQSKAQHNDQVKIGGLAPEIDSYDFVKRAAAIHDMNRFLPHMPKIEFIKGDATQTVPKFLEEHQELVISLLYVDIDLYQPIKQILPALWERIPRGGVIAFDELNAPQYPGETKAVMETIGLSNLRLRRAPYSTYVSYAIKD